MPAAPPTPSLPNNGGRSTRWLACPSQAPCCAVPSLCAAVAPCLPCVLREPFGQQQHSMTRGNLAKVDLCEPAVYMRTARGGCKLVLGGYVYRIKHKAAAHGREYYACDEDCNATVVVVGGVVRSLRGSHRHGPDTAKIGAMVLSSEPPPPPRSSSSSSWPRRQQQQRARAGCVATATLVSRIGVGLGFGDAGRTFAQGEAEAEERGGFRQHGGGVMKLEEEVLPDVRMGGGMMGPGEAGSSGFVDDVRVKMEPEWVDAGALEPNCELEGQFDDNQDFSAQYRDDALGNDQGYGVYGGQQQQQGPLPLIPDSQDPVKLRVPGKPNLTITVAQPTRQGPSHGPSHGVHGHGGHHGHHGHQGAGPSQSSPAPPLPPPLHLLNPLLGRKRGRPRGSAYGSYSESDDRVTTIITDSIIANQKLEKMGAAAAAAFHPPPVSPSYASLPSLVKPRSRDPEAVRAADIINSTQNRSGPRINEELEKVHLKLKQEVLALEVQNLKAEREKLRAYRRNVAIRREIMMLHLQLGKGFPSECASSGRGMEPVDPSESYDDEDYDFSNSVSEEEISKRLPEVSISRNQSNQSPKISIRKSLQTNRSRTASPLSSNSSAKGATPPPVNACSKPDAKADFGNSQGQSGSASRQSRDKSQSVENPYVSENSGPSNTRLHGNNRHQGDESNTKNQVDNVNLSINRLPNNQQLDGRTWAGHENSAHVNPIEVANRSSNEQSAPPGDPCKEELRPLDSVSSDYSVEMISDPGSSQWTNQSSAPMTEQEGFDDLQFEGDDSYDNTDNLGEFSGGPMVNKEPSNAQYNSPYPDESAEKRRRVENMWEPDEGPL